MAEPGTPATARGSGWGKFWIGLVVGVVAGGIGAGLISTVVVVASRASATAAARALQDRPAPLTFTYPSVDYTVPSGGHATLITNTSTNQIVVAAKLFVANEKRWCPSEKFVLDPGETKRVEFKKRERREQEDNPFGPPVQWPVKGDSVHVECPGYKAVDDVVP